METVNLHDYRLSGQITASGASFHALLMAAMRCADSANGARLASVFPEEWEELQQRWLAPHGLLPSDPELRGKHLVSIREPPNGDWRLVSVFDDANDAAVCFDVIRASQPDVDVKVQHR